MKHTRYGWVMAAVVALGMTVSAQEKKGDQKTAPASPTVAGTWTMAIEAPPPHGNMTATLTLKQDGKKVTGSFSAPGHEEPSPVQGEFADRTLKLAIPNSDPAAQTTFTARFKDDGTLAGYVSGPMGDMQWKATRK